MIKKIAALALTVILSLGFLGGAVAQQEPSNTDVGGVTKEEVLAWVEEIKAAVQNETLLNNPQDEAPQEAESYPYRYPMATLYYNTPTLTNESQLISIQVTNEETKLPRGMTIAASINDLLAAFANENEQLHGNKNFAILYSNENMPQEFMWGWVLRSGQEIYGVEYTANEKNDQGNYSYSGFYFEISDGFISSVTAFGLNNEATLQEVESNIKMVGEVEVDQSYFAYPTSTIGTDLQPFNREDMMFGGVDYIGMEPETAIKVFGQPTFDDYMEDGQEWMRTLQWEGMEIVFSYDMNKNFVGVDTINIDGAQEGPRGVKIGDSLSSVIKRFKFGEGEYDGQVDHLYGKEDSGEYGQAEYGTDGDAVIRYVTTITEGENHQQVMFYLIFFQDALTEILLSSI